MFVVMFVVRRVDKDAWLERRLRQRFIPAPARVFRWIDNDAVVALTSRAPEPNAGSGFSANVFHRRRCLCFSIAAASIALTASTLQARAGQVQT